MRIIRGRRRLIGWILGIGRDSWGLRCGSGALLLVMGLRPIFRGMEMLLPVMRVRPISRGVGDVTAGDESQTHFPGGVGDVTAGDEGQTHFPGGVGDVTEVGGGKKGPTPGDLVMR